MPRPVCICKFYEFKNGEVVHTTERCTKDQVFRTINGLLIKGWDEDLTPDHLIRIVGRDQYGQLSDFEIYEDEIHSILAGDDDLRKQIRKEYLQWRKDKEIVAIELQDSYFECCWGERWYCLGYQPSYGENNDY